MLLNAQSFNVLDTHPAHNTGKMISQEAANSYGVSVHLYIRHNKYNAPRELTGLIHSEVKELCKQLMQVAAVQLLQQAIAFGKNEK